MKKLKVTLTRVEVKEDGTLVETEKYTGHWAWKIPASVVAKMNNSEYGESALEMAATVSGVNDISDSRLETAV